MQKNNLSTRTEKQQNQSPRHYYIFMTTQKIPQETKTLIYKSTIQEAKTTHTQQIKQEAKKHIYSSVLY